MYEVNDPQAYQNAITNESQQHIRGSILYPSGIEQDITELIKGSPHIETKCVENDDTFMFGQIYIGSCEAVVQIADATTDMFTGAEITLDFGVDVEGSDEPEWVPLGIWDISSAERGAADEWTLKAQDRMHRMKGNFNIDTIGRCFLRFSMRIITERTGVEFAQTPEQLAALAGIYQENFFGIYYPQTYWDEIQMIAQVIGGFGFINRSGEMEFRKFGSTPVLTIHGDRRHNIRLAERPFSIDGIRYTDRYGQSAEVHRDETLTKGVATLAFAANRFMSVSSENYEDWYQAYLKRILNGLQGLEWYAGEVDYYGDPALDLGDMVALEAGAVGETPVNFLITGISWSFRGVQTLISAGLPDISSLGSDGSYSSTSSSSGSSSGGGIVQINQMSALKAVELDVFPGDLTGSTRKTIARGGFAVKGAADCYVDIGVVMHVTADCTGDITVLHDEVAQEFQPVFTMHSGDWQTEHFTVPISPDGGKHSLRVVARGSAEITDIKAVLWGQDITEHPADYTFSDDYTYTISAGKATVTGYHGESLAPEIPDVFEGASTAIIGNTAFTGSEITSVKIPEGVIEIL